MLAPTRASVFTGGAPSAKSVTSSALVPREYDTLMNFRRNQCQQIVACNINKRSVAQPCIHTTAQS